MNFKVKEFKLEKFDLTLNHDGTFIDDVKIIQLSDDESK